MKNLSALICGLLLSVLPSTLFAAADYKIDKIEPTLVPSPDFNLNQGGGRHEASQKGGQWLEIDVQFQTAVETSQEMTFKYYVSVGGSVLVGDVTHVNVIKGRDLHSVMYMTPRSLAKLSGGKPVSLSMIDNIAVQLVVNGQPIASLSYKPAQDLWFAAAGVQQVPGWLVNKSQTPFAALYWDRYEEIKPK